MTLKALAHSAHQSLQATAGYNAQHSHVYELLAAAFGYRTWASLRADALLADQGVGQGPEVTAVPQIAGRALQLQYGQPEALTIADALGQFIADRRLGLVRWAALAPLLPISPSSADLGGDAGDEEADEDLDDWDEHPAPRPVTRCTRRASTTWPPACCWTAWSTLRRRTRART